MLGRFTKYFWGNYFVIISCPCILQSPSSLAQNSACLSCEIVLLKQYHPRETFCRHLQISMGIFKTFSCNFRLWDNDLLYPIALALFAGNNFQYAFAASKTLRIINIMQLQFWSFQNEFRRVLGGGYSAHFPSSGVQVELDFVSYFPFFGCLFSFRSFLFLSLLPFIVSSVLFWVWLFHFFFLFCVSIFSFVLCSLHFSSVLLRFFSFVLWRKRGDTFGDPLWPNPNRRSGRGFISASGCSRLGNVYASPQQSEICDKFSFFRTVCSEICVKFSDPDTQTLEKVALGKFTKISRLISRHLWQRKAEIEAA